MPSRVILIVLMVWSGTAAATQVVDSTDGTLSPRYADLAQATQQRTGIPTLLLNGAPDKIPETLRSLEILYGHTLTPAELNAILAGVRSVQP
jgi:hypothetical protein